MVTTTMREVTLLVKNTKPFATEIQKLERKSLVAYLCMPVRPKSVCRGNAPAQAQLNDSFADVMQIAQWVETEKEAINEAERR